MKRAFFLFAALAASEAAVAAPASFEAALGAVRAQLAVQQAVHHESRVKNLGPELSAAASDARRLESNARSIEWKLRDLVWRARRRTQNPRDTDPFLEFDLKRLAWDARDFARDAASLDRRVAALATRATKDPSLVAPASDLVRTADRLRSETSSLAREARFAYMDFSRAGYQFEAWDLERETQAAEDSARRALRNAELVLAKVSG